MNQLVQGGFFTLWCRFQVILVVLGSVLACTAGWSQAQQTAALTGNVRLFPTVAAPGEPVWIIGAGERVEQGTLWVGGQPTTFTKDRDTGWLTFTVPGRAARGPQFIGMQGPAQQGLVLTVLSPDFNAQDLVVYVNAARAAELQKLYPERVKRLLEVCQRGCPKALLGTIQRLAALPFPQPGPLTPREPGAVVGGRLNALPVRPVTVQTALTANLTRQGVQLRDLLRPTSDIDRLGAARQSGFCDQLAGLLPASGLPTGQVIGLLDLLFGGELSVDPSTYGHPDQAQAPYQNAKPAEVLRKFLGGYSGSGKGVAVHVLDTASNAEDPFIMSEPVNYYGTVYNNRPRHGFIAGGITRTLAPGAALNYHQVCDKAGNCSTLKTVQALCQVAAQAKRGGKHVVNLSLGGSYPALGLQLALREVTVAGVPVAAAYGNRDDCSGLVPGDRCWHYPADWTKTFEFGPAIHLAATSLRATMLYSVAGWDIVTMQQATYNRGAGNPGIVTPPPSVQAPGEFWFGGLPYFGSSFATPVISGLLANWMTCKPGVPLLPFMNTPGQLPLPSNAVNACP